MTSVRENNFADYASERERINLEMPCGVRNIRFVIWFYVFRARYNVNIYVKEKRVKQFEHRKYKPKICEIFYVKSLLE